MRAATGTLLVALLAAAGAAEPTPRELLEAFERQLKAVHDTAGPGMACVVVSRSDQYPRPPAPPDYPGRLGGFDADAFRAGGPDRAAVARRLDLADPRTILDHESAAGVVIDPGGLVLTPYHALDGATKVYVHLPGGKGSYADVHAADARADLAVLKLLTPPAGLKAVKLADARLQATTTAAATVFPGKLVAVLAFQPTTGFAPDRASGTVSALSNVQFPGPNLGMLDVSQSVYRYAPVLEFEARSAPAVSGAAVLNLDGELIGLTSTIAAVAGGDGGRAFALPVDANTRRVVEALARGEEVEYGFLGVMLSPSAGTIQVGSVTPRSPADGRLFPGDVIVRINGNPARSFADLLYHVGCTLAGNEVVLGVRGVNGQEREVRTRVAKYRHDNLSVAATRPAPVFGLRVDWGSVLAQAPGVGAAGGVPPGVMCRELVPDSPAAAKLKDLGERGRWVITHVNDAPTPTPKDFAAAARGQDAVKLTVMDMTGPKLVTRAVTLP